MRISTFLLKAASATSPAGPPLPWIHSLTTDNLKTIARLTGIRCAGPKSALKQRLTEELNQSLFLNPTTSLSPSTRPANDLSILSIDMGVQNLAFAHLKIPSQVEKSRTSAGTPSLILNAWHHLSIPEFHKGGAATLQKRIDPNLSALSPPPSVELRRDPPTPPATLFDMSYDPHTYADYAYTLITHLIATYEPTHILIERQRFRTGRGVAVLEWALRVGVFEGMLYAVLHTLRQTRRHTYSVHDVLPRKIVDYWNLEEKATVIEDDAWRAKMKKKEKKPKRPSSKYVKKIKIELIRERMRAWRNETLTSEDDQLPHQTSQLVAVDMDFAPQAREMADAYLARSDGLRPHFGPSKLDDLADCLLQALTWVEWHVMRGRFVNEGLDALPEEYRSIQTYAMARMKAKDSEPR